jgi:glycosyltransferase involved in cell wall biosynthesis
MEPLPVSVLLLARDEAARIGARIGALAFARDVVVVVDEASADATREVAERAGARVVVRAHDGVGAQRRFALEQCREPWVLWIDADESIAPGELGRLAPALEDGSVAGWRLARVTWFLGRRIRWCGWRGERVLRLFRRERASFDDAPVHEQVSIDGRVRDLDVTLEHHSYETWDDCREKMMRYAAAGAERARRAGRNATWLDVVARPPLRFLRMYVLQLGVLDGAHGLVLCALASAQVFLKYAELWSDARRR